MNSVPQHIEVTPKELRTIGERLAVVNPDNYQGRWQTALAQEIGVTPRAIRYYLTGERPIPTTVAKLVRIIAAQAE